MEGGNRSNRISYLLVENTDAFETDSRDTVIGNFERDEGDFSERFKDLYLLPFNIALLCKVDNRQTCFNEIYLVLVDVEEDAR